MCVCVFVYVRERERERLCVYRRVKVTLNACVEYNMHVCVLMSVSLVLCVFVCV